MSVVINSNVTSLRAQRRLGESEAAQSDTYTRLASGLRITRASDDAAGLSVAAGLDVKARIYNQGVKNVNDGISLVDIADGATSELTSIVQRIEELAQQAANGVLGYSQRKGLDKEAQALAKEFNRIIETTSFNGISLFSANSQSLSLSAGGSSLDLSLGFSGTHGSGDFTVRDGPAEAITGNSGRLVWEDFNGDSILDYAALVQGGPIRTYLGNGDGTFRSPGFISGSFANLTSGDLNGDGAMDLFTLHNPWDYSSVFLNNGDGTFRAPLTSDLTGSPNAALLADVNEDGKLDIVSTDLFGGGSYLSLGRGDGTFGTSTLFSAAIASAPLADLNGDGHLDMISSPSGAPLIVCLGDGTGTFTVRQTYSTAFSSGGGTTVGDITAMGRPTISRQKRRHQLCSYFSTMEMEHFVSARP